MALPYEVDHPIPRRLHPGTAQRRGDGQGDCSPLGPRSFGDASAERQRVGSRLQERLEAQRIRGFQGRLGVVQQCDVTEVEIDGRSFWVRTVGPDILNSKNRQCY